jgi:hypothetical protein
MYGTDEKNMQTFNRKILRKKLVPVKVKGRQNDNIKIDVK